MHLRIYCPDRPRAERRPQLRKEEPKPIRAALDRSVVMILTALAFAAGFVMGCWFR